MDSATLLSSCGREGDARTFAGLAAELERDGQLALAATAYDRAFGLGPANENVGRARTRLLNGLAVREHGMVFRYVPAGSFLMGSADGDPDEQPVHAVELSAFWISEIPVSWAAYCHLMGWQPPPAGCPSESPESRNLGESRRESSLQKASKKLFGKRKREPAGFRHDLFMLHQENKIRLQYCEDRTTGARNWHAHQPDQVWTDMDGKNPTTSRDMFGRVSREDDSLPWAYDHKPMVAVSWQEAEDLCDQLPNDQVIYRLPTEAEWEKAARGGLFDTPYPWGDALAGAACCDCNRFDQFSIQPVRRFPANHYGLYAMSGCVWEWATDWYDAQYYGQSPRQDPTGPTTGQQKVLRGGSWADCAWAVTVSSRASRHASHWRDGEWGAHMAPNIGFRICRVTK